jgi:hypothetical protein
MAPGPCWKARAGGCELSLSLSSTPRSCTPRGSRLWHSGYLTRPLIQTLRPAGCDSCCWPPSPPFCPRTFGLSLVRNDARAPLCRDTVTTIHPCIINPSKFHRRGGMHSSYALATRPCHALVEVSRRLGVRGRCCGPGVVVAIASSFSCVHTRLDPLSVWLWSRRRSESAVLVARMGWNRQVHARRRSIDSNGRSYPRKAQYDDAKSSVPSRSVCPSVLLYASFYASKIQTNSNASTDQNRLRDAPATTYAAMWVRRRLQATALGCFPQGGIVVGGGASPCRRQRRGRAPRSVAFVRHRPPPYSPGLPGRGRIGLTCGATRRRMLRAAASDLSTGASYLAGLSDPTGSSSFVCASMK